MLCCFRSQLHFSKPGLKVTTKYNSASDKIGNKPSANHSFLFTPTTTCPCGKNNYAVFLSCGTPVTSIRVQSQRQWPTKWKFVLSPGILLVLWKFCFQHPLFLSFSLAFLGRGDNSRLFFLSAKSRAIVSAHMMQMSFSFFFLWAEKSEWVGSTMHSAERLQILSAHNDKTYP